MAESVVERITDALVATATLVAAAAESGAVDGWIPPADTNSSVPLGMDGSDVMQPEGSYFLVSLRAIGGRGRVVSRCAPPAVIDARLGLCARCLWKNSGLVIALELQRGLQALSVELNVADPDEADSRTRSSACSSSSSRPCSTLSGSTLQSSIIRSSRVSQSTSARRSICAHCGWRGWGYTCESARQQVSERGRGKGG